MLLRQFLVLRNKHIALFCKLYFYGTAQLTRPQVKNHPTLPYSICTLYIPTITVNIHQVWVRVECEKERLTLARMGQTKMTAMERALSMMLAAVGVGLGLKDCFRALANSFTGVTCNDCFEVNFWEKPYQKMY